MAYPEAMIRVFLADAIEDERKALRLLFIDLNMEQVGEATDWPATLEAVPKCDVDLLVVDWGLLPSPHVAAMEVLRRACPAALVILLISHHDARAQAALSSGADAFISKGEPPDRFVERLRKIAAAITVDQRPAAG